jgi:hypothetical protein
MIRGAVFGQQIICSDRGLIQLASKDRIGNGINSLIGFLVFLIGYNQKKH